jgi:hypothetical protein
VGSVATIQRNDPLKGKPGLLPDQAGFLTGASEEVSPLGHGKARFRGSAR